MRPWEDEKEAPPVDLGTIRSVICGQASPAVTRVVLRLIVRFQSWADAYDGEHTSEFQSRLARGEFKNPNTENGGESSPDHGQTTL